MSLKKFVNKKKFPDIKKILNKIKISSFAGKIENAENPSHFVTKSETARWRKKNETSRHDKKKKTRFRELAVFCRGMGLKTSLQATDEIKSKPFVTLTEK